MLPLFFGPMVAANTQSTTGMEATGTNFTVFLDVKPSAFSTFTVTLPAGAVKVLASSWWELFPLGIPA